MLGSSPGDCATSLTFSELNLAWVGRAFKNKAVYLLYVSVAQSGTDSVHQLFAHLAQAALVTMPWHLPSAHEILCAKPKLPRKLHAEGWKSSYCFGYLEALLTNGPLHPPKAE